MVGNAKSLNGTEHDGRDAQPLNGAEHDGRDAGHAPGGHDPGIFNENIGSEEFQNAHDIDSEFESNDDEAYNSSEEEDSENFGNI